jgi:hypothetical protein
MSSGPNRAGQTSYREDLAVVQELRWRASEREGANIAELLGSSDTSPLKIKLGENVAAESVTAYSMALVKALMLIAGVESLSISSAYRSPEDQARVMYDNLEQGKRIKYAPAGSAVVKKYDASHKAGHSPAVTKQSMVNEIYRLGPEEVSKHASAPGWLNVIDIQPSTVAADKRSKFVATATRLVGSYIDKFLHPGNSKDPAYHIEIPQGKLIVSRSSELSI